MKKFLLSLAAVAGMTLSATAANIVVDFSAAKDLLPKDNSETAQTVNVDGVDFTLVNCKGGVYSGASYLQISGKKVTTKGYIEFSTDIDVQAIQLHTGANASTNVDLEFLAGGASVETKNLDAKDGDFVYNIPAANQAAGTVYRLQVVNNYNAQITTLTLVEAGGEVKADAGLSFDPAEFTVVLGEAFTAPTLTKTTTAEATYTSSDEAVATVDATSGEVTIVGVGNVKITAETPENEEFLAGTASYTINVIEVAEVKKAENVAEGQYTFVAEGKYNGFLEATKAYGYLGGIAIPADATETGFNVNKAALITLAESANGCFTMTDAQGRIFGTQATYKTFDTTDKSADARDWTLLIDAATGEATITCVATGRVVYFDKTYGSFGCYLADELTDAANFVLPVLYVVDNGSSSIEMVETEVANAPVEYFNLQGMRVENPENGLYIRRQGNKVEKVVIR